MNALHALWLAQAPVLPVLLPMATAVLLLFLGTVPTGHGEPGMRLRRRLALGSVALGGLVAIGLLLTVSDGTLLVYRVGGWAPPFGIVLVIDRLSALMLVLTSTVALPALMYACSGWDARGRQFHALFQFQLMGLAGAFVTGDLFNLFVFFEILLIASYVLLTHGLGRARTRQGVHYVVINLVASSLFLIALALIYGTTGTLNMADVAARVAVAPADQVAVLRVVALLLLLVFGIKAALLPLNFWLPPTYAAASAPVAALFAIMTKVGVYSIIRVHWVVFGAGAGGLAGAAAPWLLPLALLTSVVGVLSALAAHSMGRLVATLAVVSVGTILIGVGLFTPQALSAALYYLLHSTLVVAALFLLVELIAAQRGTAGDRLAPAHAVREPVLLGLLLLLGSASLAGLPPLPGFLGKVMVLQASSGLPAQALVWTVVLGVGFLTLIGLTRAGVIVFWHVEDDHPGAAVSAGRSPMMLGATVIYLLLGAVMAVLAAPVKHYTDATAAQLMDRAAYQRAVLPESLDGALYQRPYTGERP
ncbi:monovalent cation/H+ antiporter subunit D [Amphibiibacter pelophylacis]|uniref:Monovalent cation/H+ antiporter subunit D n=1 Tax=Amphibiibacter pelophylacis TaxID=1799477 RepID=A0ACC6P0Q1_9BURK